MSKAFHIIAFDVPYPPNYGGIVDVYYKLKHLHKQGAKITYHCFYYTGHNPPHSELEKYCDKIYYYKRKKSIGKVLMSTLPYVVGSRNDINLLNNLCADENPILFDGLQCCYFLNHPKLKGRKKIVRANNIEHKYYYGLAKWEKNKIKKTYLKWEGKKLEKFEKQLAGVDAILSVAEMDIPHFSQYAPTHHIPPFFKQNQGNQLDFEIETNKFCLFQGNLSVTENIEAVNFIIKEIALLIDYQIVIAGKNPPVGLAKEISSIKNVQLIANPDQNKMDDLISRAQINLLFTFQQTGIKLKLLHALESGKHIIINSFMDDNHIFSEMCDVLDNPKDICLKINELMGIKFDEKMFKKRINTFKKRYNNDINAVNILKII